MKPLTVCTFQHSGSRPIYTPWHVRNLRTMMRKHLTVPHDFVVVTDTPEAYATEPDIRSVPIWQGPQVRADARHWLHNYVRLGLFDRNIGGMLIGERILQIDLDVVIRGNIDHLVTDDVPFKIMSLRTRQQLQGGLFLIEPGAVDPNPWHAMWEDPTLIQRSRRWVGSDQAVLSELFYGRVPTWDERDGLIINQHQWPDWKIFFRTGTRKCWDAKQPEREDYMRESGYPGEPPVIRQHYPASGVTPGGVRTRVRRYIVSRPR